MKRTSIAIYLVVVHLLLAVLLWRSTFPERIGIRDSVHPHILTMRGIHAHRDAITPPGSALFLGDSLTERMAASAVTPNAVNFGISWQRSDHLLESIPSSATQAGSIYLLIGTNDFLQGREAGIEARLQAISAELPDVPLVWSGIMLPQAHGANREIERLCLARTRCRYLAPILEEEHMLDGVHLNASGYAKWISRMKSHSIPHAAISAARAASNSGCSNTLPRKK